MTARRDVIAGQRIPGAIRPFPPAVRAGRFLFICGQPGIDPKPSRACRSSAGQL
jgi:enamine deaminase RidA (YjgF/YER057c/UK114 family)